MTRVALEHDYSGLTVRPLPGGQRYPGHWGPTALLLADGLGAAKGRRKEMEGKDPTYL